MNMLIDESLLLTNLNKLFISLEIYIYKDSDDDDDEPFSDY